MTIHTDMHSHASYIMLKTIWNNIKLNVSWYTLTTRHNQLFNDRQRGIAFRFLSWSTVAFTKSMDVVFDVHFTQQQIDIRRKSRYLQDAIDEFDQADWSDDEIRQTIGNIIILSILDSASMSSQLPKPDKHAFIDDAKKHGIEHAAVKIIDMLRMSYSKSFAIAFIIAGYDTSLWTDAEIESLRGSPLNVVEYEMLNSAMTALDDISTKYDKQRFAFRDEFDRKMQALRDEELSEKNSVCSRIDRMLSKNLSGSSAKSMIIDIRSRPF